MTKGLIVHSVIVNKEGKILLIKRSKLNDVLSGYWDIPGGTLEDGEDPVMGAIRETKEETGLDIKKLKLFFYTSNIDIKKNKQFVRLIFFTKIDSNLKKIILNPREHSDYQWFDLNKVSKWPIVNYLLPCLAELKKGPLAKNRIL